MKFVLLTGVLGIMSLLVYCPVLSSEVCEMIQSCKDNAVAAVNGNNYSKGSYKWCRTLSVYLACLYHVSLNCSLDCCDVQDELNYSLKYCFEKCKMTELCLSYTDTWTTIEDSTTADPGNENATTTEIPGNENATTTVVPGNENATTTVVPGNENATTTVVAGNENATTIVPGNENATTVVPGNENATTTVVPGNENATTVVLRNENATTVVPGNENGTTTAVPGNDVINGTTSFTTNATAAKSDSLKLNVPKQIYLTAIFAATMFGML